MITFTHPHRRVELNRSQYNTDNNHPFQNCSLLSKTFFFSLSNSHPSYSVYMCLLSSIHTNRYRRQKAYKYWSFKKWKRFRNKFFEIFSFSFVTITSRRRRRLSISISVKLFLRRQYDEWRWRYRSGIYRNVTK